MTSYALAVDVGGTFTDAVLISSDRELDRQNLTTHDDLLRGFFSRWPSPDTSGYWLVP